MDELAAEAPSLPNIALPVFRTLKVAGYELFPGAGNAGIDRPILPGVTVIAGINGLGKTTLLNVMLRLLVGPFNPQKINPFEVGAKSHELVGWKHARRFFRSRVSDGAVYATARAEISIGKHHLTVERALKDLSIKYLEYDGAELDPTEAEYGRVVVEASNVAQRYDFDFLVRYLVFFLEHRIPLFWNDRGQIEAFRILLCEAQLADEFRKLEDDIRTKDSLYRNHRWHVNTLRNKLLRERSLLTGSSGQAAKVAALSEELQALKARDADLIKEINSIASERSSLRSSILIRKIELEEATRAAEGLQQGFLLSIFPEMSDTARHVFGSLLSSRGCTVCGNRSARGQLRLQRLLDHGDCPACESPQEEQEQHARHDDLPREQLEHVAATVARLRKSIAGEEAREREIDSQLRQLFVDERATKQEMADRLSVLRQASAELPATAEELQALEVQVEDGDAELAVKLAELNGLYTQYEDLLTAITARVTQVGEKVKLKFAEYAKAFLSESCSLGQQTYSETLGESRRFTYPCFNVFMTSAVSPDEETERTHTDDVSESQREFIDLAFRMALIAAATSEKARSMLVIETPEASLDTYFVKQAGQMLREFAAGDSVDGNVVIVSSNLASHNMIPALLGLDETVPEDAWPDASQVNARVLNLLAEGAPNAALRDRRRFYEDFLEASTKGRITHARS